MLPLVLNEAGEADGNSLEITLPRKTALSTIRSPEKPGASPSRATPVWAAGIPWRRLIETGPDGPSPASTATARQGPVRRYVRLRPRQRPHRVDHRNLPGARIRWNRSRFREDGWCGRWFPRRTAAAATPAYGAPRQGCGVRMRGGLPERNLCLRRGHYSANPCPDSCAVQNWAAADAKLTNLSRRLRKGRESRTASLEGLDHGDDCRGAAKAANEPKDLYEIGEIPPLGHVPKNMYALGHPRKERHGEPEKSPGRSRPTVGTRQPRRADS